MLVREAEKEEFMEKLQEYKRIERVSSADYSHCKLLGIFR